MYLLIRYVKVFIGSVFSVCLFQMLLEAVMFCVCVKQTPAVKIILIISTIRVLMLRLVDNSGHL